MNYSGLYFFDVLNGSGFRTVLFISGCDKNPKCKHCQNPQAWNHKYGEKFTDKEELEILNSLAHPAVKGLSLLGGEPSDNLEDGTLFKLLDRIKNEYPLKDIWSWTGYKFEDMINNPLKRRFLEYVDVLIDGAYIPELKDLNRPYGNSSNQRIIKVKETLKNKNIEIMEGCD